MYNDIYIYKVENVCECAFELFRLCSFVRSRSDSRRIPQARVSSATLKISMLLGEDAHSQNSARIVDL